MYRWDLRTQRAALRHKDEGSMCGCSIGVSPDGSRYAIGSDMGVVNVYDTNAVSSFAADEAKLSAFGVPIHAPKPAQSIMNLRTAVDHLKFNHDGQILTIASQRMKDSLKLVHVSSGSVFANWPTSKTPLSYVTSLDFSPHSGKFVPSSASAAAHDTLLTFCLVDRSVCGRQRSRPCAALPREPLPQRVAPNISGWQYILGSPFRITLRPCWQPHSTPNISGNAPGQHNLDSDTILQQPAAGLGDRFAHRRRAAHLTGEATHQAGCWGSHLVCGGL